MKEKLIRCIACNTPLAKIEGSDIYLIKNQNGKPVSIKVSVVHDMGGSFKVACECGGGYSFARTEKSLPMSYVIAKPKKKPRVNKKA